MGTSDGGGVGGECSVGTIVWVRRRNGSWWPGRILGLHELSASHLMSPRSGTPVKLLGREDASVDWYNLEKSKRVKEFRCGEFDACIERAEASQSIPIKKREKYARREDAIIHALELEKHHKLVSTSNGICNKINGAPKNDSVVLSSKENFKRHDQTVAHGNQKFSLKYDNAEAIPRMRGLQDFGLRTAQSKRKPSLSPTWENSRKSSDNHVDSFSRFDNIIEGADQASTSRNAVSVRRKRSCGSAVDEFFVKKRDRRRPLVQVLQSSAKLSPSCSFQPNCSILGSLNTHETEKIGSTWKAKRSRCVYLPADLDDEPDHGGCNSEYMPASSNQFEICNDISYSENVCKDFTSSSLIEMNNTEYCDGDLLESNMLEETDMLTDATDILLPGSKDYELPELQLSGEFRSLIREDVPISSFILQLNGQAKEDTSLENGVSKWRMKGKRNVRNVGKRLADAVDLKTCGPDLDRSSGSMKSTSDVKESSSMIEIAETSGQRIPKTAFYLMKPEIEYPYDDCHLIDKDLDQNQLIDSDLNSLLGEPVKEVKPQLVNVELKVQASYQGEHVPLVSLMSRLNGKAIIGHPIPIETLEDGSSDHLIVSAHDAIMDEGTAPQAMWWTARRTAMHRIPRSIPSAAAFDEEDDADLLRRPLLKKACYRYLNHRVRTLTTKKFQKNRVKRISQSSRKTRKLSSLASIESVVRVGTILGGSSPRVTCIPVKVVFSRILEAVGRPQSSFACRVRTSGPRI